MRKLILRWLFGVDLEDYIEILWLYKKIQSKNKTIIDESLGLIEINKECTAKMNELIKLTQELEKIYSRCKKCKGGDENE